MAYYTDTELQELGFKHLGKNVKISTKASVYNCDQIQIGDNSRVDDFCVLSGRIIIGCYVHIAPFCLLAGGEKGIFMEDFSGLAYGVQVFTQSDDYSGRTMTNPNVPAKFKKEIKREITIGRHAIIGASTLILPGVQVAEGTSVGAMSLLRKSTEPWSVYNGNPATKLKNRRKDLLELEQEFFKEMNK